MPTPPFDPYAVLQVLPTAEQEVVNAAFKALAFKYHHYRDATRRAANKMIELNRAYTLVLDAKDGTTHDRSRRMTIAGVSVADSSRPGSVPPPAAAAAGSVL